MADTGFKFPGARTMQAGCWFGLPYPVTDLYTGPDQGWPHEFPCYGQNAVATLYTYAFNVPVGATINGIEVYSIIYLQSGSSYTVGLSWDGGASYVSKSHTTPGASYQYITQGGPTDKWGRSWSASEFNDINFVARITMSKTTSSLDIIDLFKIKVYYTGSTPKALAGYLHGISHLNGDLLKMCFLEGASYGVSNLTGDIYSTTQTPLAGVIPAVSSLPNAVLGNISDVLHGPIDAVSTANGFLKPKFSVLYVPNHVEQMQSRLIEPFK